MEVRDIEILLVLAEELHFGRTAARLHITQARVSQVVKTQERKIGATLFERTNRKVALTPIGKQLVEDLQSVHNGLHESLARARLAAKGKSDLLKIGMISLNHHDLKPIFDAFNQRHPGCDIQIRHVSFGDPFAALRAGQIDLGIIWLPVREPDLTAGPIVFTEPIVLAMSVGHPLARRQSVSLEDLAGQTVMGGATPEYWREALVPTKTPSGRPIPIGPYVTNFEQMLPILATGEAISPVYAHASRYVQRTDITFVPIHDAPPGQWALIWRTAAETDLTHAFAETVADHGPLNL